MGELAHLKGVLKGWRDVSAFTPSSQAVVHRLSQRIPFEEIKTVVEFGPGSGVITAELLRNLSPNALLIGIELNREFYNQLRRSIHDRRFSLVCDNAENLLEIMARHGLSEVDCIVSGIPFFWLPAHKRERIIRASHQALSAGGQFLALQMCHVTAKYLRSYLESRFSSVKSEIEMRNLPPLRIYQAIK